MLSIISRGQTDLQQRPCAPPKNTKTRVPFSQLDLANLLLLLEVFVSLVLILLSQPHIVAGRATQLHVGVEVLIDCGGGGGGGGGGRGEERGEGGGRDG